MKTILARLKVLVETDSTLEGYIGKVETVSPRTLPLLNQDIIPYVGFAPSNSVEQWASSGKKDANNTVEAYLVHTHMVQEDSLIGSDDKQGLLDFVGDFKTAIRGSFLLDDDDVEYLSKPLDILNTEYITADYGDGYYTEVATVTLLCIHQFIA